MKRAFSLIELLASMALLALLLVVGLTIIGSATRMSGTAVRRTELREEARFIFDRISLDLTSMVRADTCQIKTAAGTDSVISLIIRNGGAGGGRLQRVDYRMGTNGLFRHVRDIDWNDSQDLSSVPQGPGELLSTSVGRIETQAIMNDGSTRSNLDTPPGRATPVPVSLVVGLALADPHQRKNRNLAAPTMSLSTDSITWSVSAADEKQGWRLSQGILRLP